MAGLTWVGDMYAVRFDVLAMVLGSDKELSRSATYTVLKRWRDMELVEYGEVLPGQTWVWLTRSGLELVGLPYSKAGCPALGRLGHLQAINKVRGVLERHYGDGLMWTSERRMIFERNKHNVTNPKARATYHMPDGKAALPNGNRVVVEVEITRKTPVRLRKIMADLRSNNLDSNIYYYVNDATLPLVQQTAAELKLLRDDAIQLKMLKGGYN